MENDYRALFNGIEVPVKLYNGNYSIPINFDNAATTPPLKAVDAVIKESIDMYGAIHRGGQKALYSTQQYEDSKLQVLNFFNLLPSDGYTVIYVKNTTEGINLLANELCDHKLSKVLTTRMEHHANDLPWRRNAAVFYVDVNENGGIDIEDIEEKLTQCQGSIQYVAVTAAANVTGYVNPIYKIAKIAHAHGAMIIVDAAQLVAHRSINMRGNNEKEKIDFLVFSGHKMYAPFGSGAIVGRKDVLEEKAPYLVGGGTVTAVLDYDIYLKKTPDKEEAGTPNFLGVMAVSAAMQVLKSTGFERIEIHENRLKDKLLAGLKCIPKVVLYGDPIKQDGVGVIPFNIEGMSHSRTGKLLADIGGIAVRNGCFCAQPYTMRLLGISEKERYDYMLHPEWLQPGMVRASLGLYNTEEEVERFLETLEYLIKYEFSNRKNFKTLHLN